MMDPPRDPQPPSQDTEQDEPSSQTGKAEEPAAPSAQPCAKQGAAPHRPLPEDAAKNAATAPDDDRESGPCAKHRRQRRLTREQIIAAAAASFYTNGYADTTLATVADQLNVTDKAIYYYFESKDLLYLETVNVCMDWVTAVIDDIDTREISGLDKIKAFASMVIRNSTKRRRYLRSLPDHLAATDLGRRYRAIERAQEDALIGWVREGIADGSIRPDDPKMLWKWNQGALIWLDAWAREATQYDADDLERAALTMLDRSLGRIPGEHGTD